MSSRVGRAPPVPPARGRWPATATRQGTPRPRKNTPIRTRLPGPFLGATSTAATPAGSSIPPKWSAKPCAATSTFPGARDSAESRPKDRGLPLVGQQQRDQVARGSSTGGGNRLETVAFGTCVGRRARQLGDHHAAAAIAEILGLCVTLRAVAQHGDGLSLQQRKVGVGVLW